MLPKLTMLFLALLLGCKSAETYNTVRDDVWKKGVGDHSISLGYLEIRSSSRVKTEELLRSSLRFHLSAIGYSVADIADYEHVFTDKQISLQRPLGRNDLLLLTGSLRERFLIQGYLYETSRPGIPEDRSDLALFLTIFDTRSGSVAGEFRLFASDLKPNEASNLFQLSGRFVSDFQSTEKRLNQ